MKAITELFARIPETEELFEAIERGRCPVAAGGLGAVHKAVLAAAIRQQTGRPVLVVGADEGTLSAIGEDIHALTGERALHLPVRDFIFHKVDGLSREWEQRRVGVLDAAAGGGANFFYAVPEALVMRTMPPEVLARLGFTLSLSEEYDLTELVSRLVRAGYRRFDTVEGCGQFALRGGILDVFPPGAESPCRMEFFGDEINSMGLFDLASQRRIETASEVRILPVSEVPPEACGGSAAEFFDELEKAARRRKSTPEAYYATLERDRERAQNGMLDAVADRYIGQIFPQFACALDHFPEDTVVLVDDSARMRERLGGYYWQQGEDLTRLLADGVLSQRQTVLSLEQAGLEARLSDRVTIFADSILGRGITPAPRTLLSYSVKQLPSFGAGTDMLLSDLGHYTENRYGVLVLAGTARRAANLCDLLREHGVASVLSEGPEIIPDSTVLVSPGSLSSGMEFPSVRRAVLTEGVFTQGDKRRTKKRDPRSVIRSFTDLTPGDLVVHDSYGIGRFDGLQRMDVDNTKKDYIKITYAGTDTLYVPVTQLDSISKYFGSGDDERVKLNKLGSGEWQRARAKAKGAAKDLAKYLIGIYAARERTPGFAFPPDNEWQREFEERFEYEETDDQLRTTDEIKQDMERGRPMDRLLCGDVGFGKTEVAFRAVMKCVTGGRQAAMLVPTTVLARQHYMTAINRFRGYPVNIGVLSRFTPPGETSKLLRGLKNGTVDFVIGTHKLLQKDIKFNRLGLLIVDEEQRFGVGHKERLKEMSREVDALTLTATPIPRTLNMALSGIRDMSVLDEAPSDRHPVQTYVLEHDLGILCDAIRREVQRGGQVYYLHNRVDTITQAAAKLSIKLPGIRIGIGHGRMDERELSEVMNEVIDGSIQVLVCTTIIETGIDIPNVNTLIIEDADRLGLTQLHQIRGRVGRSSRHAFAYLTYRPGRALTEVATKRLTAIREFAEFGAGLRIAMRDLEIRGAGNVLGAEQSGFMLSVGYDLYLRLIEEAVLEEKGEAATQAAECIADLPVAANIPDDYIPSDAERMDLYRRIAYIRSDADASDIRDELLDRYGEYPAAVDALIEIALLRADAMRGGVKEVALREGSLVFSFERADHERLAQLYGDPAYKNRLLLNAGKNPHIAMRLRAGEAPLPTARQLAGKLADGEKK